MLIAGAASAQQAVSGALSRWFSESEAHAAYRSIEPELVVIFNTAVARSLPTSLLINRMNLGAARRLSSDDLLSGIRREVALLQEGVDLLDRLESEGLSARTINGVGREELLNTLSIYMRGGLSADFLAELLDRAVSSGRTLDTVFQVCAVVLNVKRAGHFEDTDLVEFATSLLSGAISPAGYGAVGSFIVRAASSGHDPGGIVRSVSRILRQGGGLPQMELEIGRRR